jgi:hypothetical protein
MRLVFPRSGDPAALAAQLLVRSGGLVQGLQHLMPSQADAFPDWWLRQRKRVHKDSRKGFDCLVAFICGSREMIVYSTIAPSKHRC